MKVEYLDVACRAEIRKGNKLGGYASVFNEVTDLGWAGKEAISEEAFRATLAAEDSDVRALYNHDPLYLLGRQTSGTLRVRVDSTGLEYEVDLPNTSYAKDVYELVERKDVTGASFGFIPDEYEEREGVIVHTSVKRLVDVSPVPFPAYHGATTQARNRKMNGPSESLRSQLIRARARVHLGRV